MNNLDLEDIKKEFDKELSQSQSENDLFELKGKYIGKKRGIISSFLEKIPSLPPEERKNFGKEVNNLKNYIEEKISSEFENIHRKKSSLPDLDLTLPGRNIFSGKIHPLSRIKEEIEDIFISMGYAIATGPEIEDPYHNFEALNTPEDHPSRDIQDTFYLDVENLLLRTQTSPVQIRSMERKKPPIKLVAPGRVFRRDDDVSHSPMFFQLEGLVVDENITMADLKGTLLDFYRKLFRKDVSIRFRASYFPFTEPSAETDLSCVICNGYG
ncbi:MAG: phenylalanine--tRNA ligase subunit alpha, partial [Acidobacteria bacterium]|nr:phenylalanine--tRNA ligase subunit alpha [Acidobacteriota bacterium]